MIALPTVTVEWGESLPTVALASTVWEDVSAAFRGAEIRRGRQTELARIGAGTATLVLSNADRAFDPTYSAGPHYAYLKPRRRIRLRATYSATTYDMFTGYVDKITQRYAPPREAVAVVEATDGLSVLAQAGLPTSVYAAEVLADGPAAWWRLGEPQGSTVFFDAIGTAHLTVTGTPAPVASLIVRESNQATYFTGAEHAEVESAGISSTAYTIEAWLKIPNVGGPAHVDDGDDTIYSQAYPQAGELFADYPNRLRVVVRNRSDANPGTVSFTDDNVTVGSTVRIDDDAPHHIAAVRQTGGTLKIYVDGIDRTASAATGTATPAPGRVKLARHPTTPTGWDAIIGTLDEIAIYNTALSAARIAAHNDAGRTPWRGDTSGARIGRVLDVIAWPAADRSLDTGQATLQSASLGISALDYVQKVEESEAGLLFVDKSGRVRFRSRHGGFNLPTAATFGDANDGVELGYTGMEPYLSVESVRNDVRVSRADGVVHRAVDQGSVNEYQLRTLTLEGLLHESDAESLDRANYMVGIYAAPQTRIDGLTIDPHQADPGPYLTQILARELGEQIQVRRRPQGVGTTMTLTARIEGTTVSVAPGRWGASWNISPELAGEFLQLDDTDGPGLGGVRLAY